MPASYPGAIKTFVARVAGQVARAAHIQDIQDEVTAIETALGTNPAGKNGWAPAGETWTYASANTVTVSGDVRTRYPTGTKVKLTQTTVKYFYVTGAAYGAPNTTLTLAGGSDYSIANAAVTANYLSYTVTPQGFPAYHNFTPTLTQMASITVTVYYARFAMIGKRVSIWTLIGATTAGTAGNALALGALPIAAVVADNYHAAGAFTYLDSGTGVHSGNAVVAGSTTALKFWEGGSASDFFGISPAMTVANNDVIGVHADYLA